MAPYNINIAHYTGPLDLLLHLLRINEMDIFDLDLALITEQYLAVVETQGVRDLPEAYSFLAMAATLVEMKSRLLLPRQQPDEAQEGDEEPEDDPRAQLARQLAAYQSIQEVTVELSQRYEQTGRHWPRQVVEQLEAEIVYSLDSLNVYDLMTAFHEVINRPKYTQITIFREDYDLEQAREWLTEQLSGSTASLTGLLLKQGDIYSLVVTFIAVLDLIKEERISFERSDGSVLLSLVDV